MNHAKGRKNIGADRTGWLGCRVELTDGTDGSIGSVQGDTLRFLRRGEPNRFITVADIARCISPTTCHTKLHGTRYTK
jgi:hypothetical protein